ncbi:hypothetical protein GAP32_017 [Cronobacter phage vB_CsaM_GAP32]|uniref:Uncharacterized protein n=2 Tax=Mimasvirus TaxID=2560176 RepID=A0A1L2CVW1_9CAUD|nr:hypothetical protein GAP32_017 [Cronobacter phage vB_CsaM_GAP32]YP_009594561.1 hypothetical protein FDG95_gp021 [Pectobacterium phage vB_PcaM_CBB]YP_009595114.1 hypothetical protein FDG95_gp405 [Pectobacterium phage vB_PcaM_CBB]AFC21464.1 hypothetical protein GAP32_017 [Cronobacter phage vB_CsaM_GAP32]AMM43586.1 hypothetical protein CBB_574 [Pectobacterium phage vB_PcaM_CBB]AMM44137.1 hypothetical protein CBB_21 [Pectobacterium phage vB_PcaM_CBB]
MSLYDVTVNSTGIGRSGTTKMLAVAFFPHMNEARQGINEWVSENFVAPVTVSVELKSHSNIIYPSEVQGYERIVIIE